MEIGFIIEEFILNYGLISIFIIVALEYANLPLPSEIVLPLAGILSTEYNMNVILVILVSILGGIVGSLTNYYLGYKFGNPLIYALKSKYPKTQRAIKESYRFMEKYENISVMLSRLVPIARTFISIVAGVTRMNIMSFVFYSTIGISIWNILLILIGYIIGDNMDKITYILGTYSKVVAVLLVSVAVVYLIIRKNKSKNVEEEDKIIYK
ncbi:DedA family protein [Terrisporobacter sp.]|uniref:DedA family protein n=1 Tax=Terrisporobacter sp. TaxID=1965305 RepID=UPI00260F314E|nr:DedA family protein [Terrisporobacter sp.]